MDIKEAIEEIKSWTPDLLAKGEKCTNKTIEAQKKAIESLEAWDQVIKDLQEYYDAAAAASVIISGTQQFTIENCIEIVKRNLGG